MGNFDRNPSSEVAEFLPTVNSDSFSKQQIDDIKYYFLDTIGVTLAGSATGAGRVSRFMAEEDEGTISVIGYDIQSSLTTASFVNGTAAHTLDYDDYSESISGHPSVILVPTILGVTEYIDEPVTGNDAIEAYIAGFETMAYLGKPILDSHYEHGWHSTGTLGTFGAAAVVASLLDYDAEEIATTINIAASMVSGLRANFGTMTKPMHVGHAIRSGITAARLASNGFTASKAATDDSTGFVYVYAGERTPESAESIKLGSEWSIERDGVNLKKYPSCGATQSPIAATDSLVSKYKISPSDIDRVEVIASPITGDALIYPDPSTAFEAKFSMHYTVARMIHDRTITIDTFTDEAVTDSSIRDSMDRIEHVIDENLDYNSFEAEVIIETSSGQYHERILHPPGHSENPMSGEEHVSKFIDCAQRASSSVDSTSVIEFVRSIDQQPNVASLMDLL